MNNTVILERLRFGVEAVLTNDFEDVRVDFTRTFTGEILLQAQGFIWAEQHKRFEIKYPLDWREAFKERWFPALLLRRWPVQYKCHVIDVKTLYPGFKPAMPHQANSMRVFPQEF